MQEVRNYRPAGGYCLATCRDGEHTVLHELKAGRQRRLHRLTIAARPGLVDRPRRVFSTDRSGGLATRTSPTSGRLVDMMAPVAEIFIYRNIAETVTDTYLGHIVGEQILGGLIKRGDGKEINAVLWFSDLRDFTGLNERMAPSDLLGALNNYLQLVGDALKANGGEILKFIGDGVMAYFPAEDALFLPMVTATAHRRRAAADRRHRGRPTRRAPPAATIRCASGVGLHVGPVTVRQHRHRGPARLHRDRPRRQSRGAAREA
jgi:adenylate cyclase